MKGRVKTKRNKALYLIGIGIMLLMVVSAVPMMVHSAGNLPKVTVFQENSSAVPKELSFTYLLAPREADNPMPTGSTEKGFTFSVSGKGSTQLLFSENLRAGSYHYDLTQVIEEKKANVIYDQSSYRLELHIDGDGEATLLVYSQDDLKVDEIKFQNDFKVEAIPPPQDDEPKPPPEKPTPPERPTPPEKPSPPERPSIPGKLPITGDNINFWLESLGIVAAMSILIIVAVAKKKKAREKKTIVDL